MTLEQLHMLHAIVSEGTFRGAAQRVFKSQSALSHAIKKLETEVGFEIFTRDQYRPTLTPSGEVFYRHAVEVLHSMKDLTQVAKQLEHKQEPKVTLAITATCPIAQVLRAINQINTQYPMTHIQLFSEMMGGPAERLFTQQADIIIAGLDGIATHQVEAIPFLSTEILPVAHHTHPLAQTKKLLSVGDIQPYSQIVVTDSSHNPSFSQSRDVLEGGQKWTVSDLQTKKAIILAKMGWGGLPKYLIEKELNEAILIPLAIDGFPPRHASLFIIKRVDHSLGIVGQARWDLLQTHKT